jgi:hypothetical protein
MDQIVKQIAAAEGMSEPTVREHLEEIKRKLCTDDLVNAVVIAVKTGMLLPGTADSQTRSQKCYGVNDGSFSVREAVWDVCIEGHSCSSVVIITVPRKLGSPRGSLESVLTTYCSWVGSRKQAPAVSFRSTLAVYW